MASIIDQGTLNRLRSSVVVALAPYLNVTAPYMGKSFVKIDFESDYAQLIPTATGGVTSPEPYVMANISVSLLRTQGLSATWLAQAQLFSAIGPITVYPDAKSFPIMTFQNCVINKVDPGAYDGTDPVVRVTMKGIFYVNSELWAAA